MINNSNLNKEYKPLLSLCIPTFNRAFCLINQLERIKNNLINFDNKNNIEICISDNASTDNTLKVIEEYKKYFDIQLFKNKKNYGALVNQIHVLEMASGKYVWLLSDDDLIENESLSYLYRIISNNDFDILHVKIVSPFKHKDWNFNYYKSDSIISKKNYIEFLKKDKGVGLQYISSTIFKKKFINFALFKDLIKKSTAGFDFLLIFLVFEQISNINKAYLTKPIINQINTSGLYFSSNEWLTKCFQKIYIFQLLFLLKKIDKKLALYFIKNTLLSKRYLKDTLMYLMACDNNLKELKIEIYNHIKTNPKIGKTFTIMYKFYLLFLTSKLCLPFIYILSLFYKKKIENLHLNKPDVSVKDIK